MSSQKSPLTRMPNDTLIRVSSINAFTVESYKQQQGHGFQTSSFAVYAYLSCGAHVVVSKGYDTREKAQKICNLIYANGTFSTFWA